MEANINILEIRLQNNKTPLKAFVDLSLNELIIRDFRIIQQPGHKAYVTSPQTSWRNPQGKPNFKTLISMPDELKWQVEIAILAQYQKVKEHTHGKPTCQS